MARKNKRLRGLEESGGASLRKAYTLGVYKAFSFLGTHLVGATITALTFAFVYKYIVLKNQEKEQTP